MDKPNHRLEAVPSSFNNVKIRAGRRALWRLVKDLAGRRQQQQILRPLKILLTFHCPTGNLLDDGIIQAYSWLIHACRLSLYDVVPIEYRV